VCLLFLLGIIHKMVAQQIVRFRAYLYRRWSPFATDRQTDIYEKPDYKIGLSCRRNIETNKMVDLFNHFLKKKLLFYLRPSPVINGHQFPNTFFYIDQLLSTIFLMQNFFYPPPQIMLKIVKWNISIYMYIQNVPRRKPFYLYLLRVIVINSKAIWWRCVLKRLGAVCFVVLNSYR
jgi:hypothetical protein